MPNVIVTDTSCLILFYKIGEFDLLKEVFDTLHITETVQKEFNQPIPDWIVIFEPTNNLHQGLSSYLDKGEATAGYFGQTIPLVSELIILDNLTPG